MKKNNIKLSLALAAVFSSSVVFAEVEVSGKIVHESAVFDARGNTIGSWANRTKTGDIQHGRGALMKSETSARIYIDGELDEVNEGATYHVELNLMRDSEGVDKYDGNESYTQRDALREAYIDTEVENYSIRAGKQQVVWGTADGMKLLDVINPTDYSEMAQNQMEDSRIPVWMLNAETETGNSSWQIVLSEAKSHKIAGLGQSSGVGTSHTNGNTGQAFIMKGVDSITGKTNGLLNVAPALGKVAAFFTAAAGQSADAHSTAIQSAYTGATVDEFVMNRSDAAAFSGLTVDGCKATMTAGLSANATSAHCLWTTANSALVGTNGFTANAMGGNGDITNLIDSNDATNVAANWDASSPNTMFEYMGETAFATFFNFSNMKSQYVVDHDESVPNFGGRYKTSTKDGMNYSFNFLSHEDPNPYVNISFVKQSDGSLLTTKYNAISGGGTCTNGTCSDSGTYLTLQSGGVDWDPTSSNVAVLKFEEKTNRIESLGGSFDAAIETAAFGPVVLRGEALYDVGVMTPIVDLAALNIGDGAGAVTTQEGDKFSYVLGADITALTNMMVSGQFIQQRNLDYVDITHTPSDTLGNASHVSGARYTGDAATMHITNGLRKADRNKEFVSLFLSKPFGASGEHRWNNILMLELGDKGTASQGRWNRLDVEYSINDDVQATAEYNKYWGDDNSQFGQLKKSSNIQVGVKYSF